MNGFSPQALQSGFTLLELIQVMLIVAILAAIGIPSFKYVTSSNRIATEVNQLLGDMRYARTEAVKEGQPVTVCASANATTSTPTCSHSAQWETGWIVFSNPNYVSGNNPQVAAGAIVLRTQNALSAAFSSTDTITADNTFSAETFNREGFGAANIATPANTVTMALHSTPSNTDWTRCLQITPIGMLTVIKTTPVTVPPCT